MYVLSANKTLMDNIDLAQPENETHTEPHKHKSVTLCYSYAQMVNGLHIDFEKTLLSNLFKLFSLQIFIVY